MILHRYHGRIKHDGPPTHAEWNEVDECGLEGPQWEGVKSLVWTYGDLAVLFESKEAYEAAEAKTKWLDAPFDNSLRMSFTDDVVRTFNTERVRYEFFGDWSLANGVQL